MFTLDDACIDKMRAVDVRQSRTEYRKAILACMWDSNIYPDHASSKVRGVFKECIKNNEHYAYLIAE
jgi:hypothetical protein